MKNSIGHTHITFYQWLRVTRTIPEIFNVESRTASHAFKSGLGVIQGH